VEKGGLFLQNNRLMWLLSVANKHHEFSKVRLNSTAMVTARQLQFIPITIRNVRNETVQFFRPARGVALISSGMVEQGIRGALPHACITVSPCKAIPLCRRRGAGLQAGVRAASAGGMNGHAIHDECNAARRKKTRFHGTLWVGIGISS
jgi:hypothetical protein